MKRSPLKRKTPIKRQSERGARYMAEYRLATRKVKRRSKGWCEIKARHECDGSASPFPHHRKMRSQGGSNDPHRNLIDVCWSGHEWIHRLLPYEEAVRLQLITPREAEETPYRP